MMYFYIVAIFLGVFITPKLQGDSQNPCHRDGLQISKISRRDTYGDKPFKPGEEAKYELRYGFMRALVGYGFLRVRSPLKYEIFVKEQEDRKIKEKRYHMVFQAEAYTGEWYKLIFVGHDKIQAISRPWDFGISKFYINQNEIKPFVRELRVEKWLEFQQYNCEVNIREKDNTKAPPNNEKLDSAKVQYGAIDTLGAIYKLRMFDFKLGNPVKFLVFSSKKNWWLEAIPLQFEKVEVAAGTFDTVKLRLKTYLGKELQQRGNAFVWMATKSKYRQLVKVEAEVTFGSIYLSLQGFKPGRS